MLFLKEAFPMPLGTVATRIAKASARSFCCHNRTLFACLSRIKYERYCIVQTVPKTHTNLRVCQYFTTRLFQRVNEWHWCSKQRSVVTTQLDLYTRLRFAMLCFFFPFICFILHFTLKKTESYSEAARHQHISAPLLRHGKFLVHLT